MIKQTLIAQNITNLTDARYFAAWGVAYVSFNTTPGSEYEISTEDIKEIADWLEGPKILIESNTLEFDELADGMILDTIYSSLPLSKEAFYRTSFGELKKGLPQANYIIKIESEKELASLQNIEAELISDLNLFLDISDIKLKNKSLLANHGIVLQGGDEEKPGVKSFDDLDELFDLLME